MRAPLKRGRETLRVTGLATETAGPVTFSAFEGEVLGLVGLRGAGQEAIARALFGAEPSTGSVCSRRQAAAHDIARGRTAAGRGLIARDRTEESIAPALSIRENTFPIRWPSADLDEHSRRPAPRPAGPRYRRGGGPAPQRPALAVEALSGGNLTEGDRRALARQGRKLVVAEDPTAGVDVGAKSDIYRLVALAAPSRPGSPSSSSRRISRRSRTSATARSCFPAVSSWPRSRSAASPRNPSSTPHRHQWLPDP